MAATVPPDMDTLSPMSTVSSNYRVRAGAEPLSRRSSAASLGPATALRPSLTRRTSLEEDFFYREVFTVERKPNEPPPSYETTIKKIRRRERTAAADRKPANVDKPSKSAKGKGKAPMDSLAGQVQSLASEDVLPPYSCDLHIEGVFLRKMEIQNTTKRAEDRRWNTEYLVLHGTALEVYECRKDRSWAGRTAKTGPGVSPDRPPWMRKAALEKKYSLLYADVGIAADYIKRRYVIRIRAETDQFLISCVELETFVQWLDALFAAISIAAPIDERDFPRDQSIPRVQRIRWFNGRGREPAAEGQAAVESQLVVEGQELGVLEDQQPEDGQASAPQSASLALSRTVSSQPVPPPSRAAEAATVAADATVAGPSTHAPLNHVSAQQLAAARAMQSQRSAPSVHSGKSSVGVRQGSRFTFRSIKSRLAQKRQKTPAPANNNNNRPNDRGSDDENDSNGGPSHGHGHSGPEHAVAGIGARSGFSPASHAAVDGDGATGKWQPSHRWTKTHDMVYARLCYATLLFRSPRKSNYIIVRGKRWLVDWKTGNMARVSPPWYGEVECQPGPWQIMRTENLRI